MKTLIEKGIVVTPKRAFVGDVLVEDDHIADVGSDLASSLGGEADLHRIPARDRIVLPGGVDGHTHLDMPLGDIGSADDFFTGTRAAALGGTTTIVDYAEQGEASLSQGLDTWMAKAEGDAVVDYGFHMTVKKVTPEVVSEMAAMCERGVTSFKVFTAYPGRMMLADDEIRRVMGRAAELDGVVVVHAEDGVLIEELIKRAQRARATEPIDHALTRPSSGEARAAEKVLAMAEQTGCPVVIAHISACQAAQAVAEARKRGVRAHGETCPHYLWLEQSRLREPGLQGAAYICSPPLRDVTHMHCLWQAMSDGWIDVLGTDHCPFNLKGEKDRGLSGNGAFDFTKVPGGLPGIELRLLLAYVGGVLAERFDLVRLAKVFSEIPAKVFGLAPTKGALIEGADADIVIFDPEAVTSFDAEDLSMNVDYSPYEGLRLEGAVETVLSRGEIIVSERRFVGRRGRGRFLKCGPYGGGTSPPRAS
jgi:dihydropyrimidinase